MMIITCKKCAGRYYASFVIDDGLIAVECDQSSDPPIWKCPACGTENNAIGGVEEATPIEFLETGGEG